MSGLTRLPGVRQAVVRSIGLLKQGLGAWGWVLGLGLELRMKRIEVTASGLLRVHIRHGFRVHNIWVRVRVCMIGFQSWGIKA